MLTAIVIILILLWFLGYIHISAIPIPDVILFHINNSPITLWDILILIVVSWAISILPTPFRQIAAVLLILWILATLGILAFAGLALSNILVVVIILGIVLALFGL